MDLRYAIFNVKFYFLFIISVLVLKLKIRENKQNKFYKYQSPNKMYKILLYRGFFHYKLFPEFDEFECDIKKHFIIKRSDELEPFDIIIVHYDDYNKYLLDVYSTKNKKVVILYSMEAPFLVKFKLGSNFILKSYNYLTISYLKSSFYWVGYGIFWYTNISTYNELETWNQFIKRTPGSVASISNCWFPNSIRVRFVNRIKYYHDVYTIGHCFFRKSPSKILEKLLNTRMFHFALESSLCVEYITEKYWNSISNHIIPIIFVHPQSYKSLIPGSYINIFKYNSLNSLLKELNLISSNFTHYKKYFEWKKYISFTTRRNTSYMKVCDFLHKTYKYMNSERYDDPTIKNVNNLNLCITGHEQSEWLKKFMSGY